MIIKRFNKLKKKIDNLTTLTPSKILGIFFIYILVDWTLTYFNIFKTEFRDFLSRYAIVIPLHITFYYYGRSEQGVSQNSKRIDRITERTAASVGELEVHIARLKADVLDIRTENRQLKERIMILLEIIENQENKNENDSQKSSFPKE